MSKYVTVTSDKSKKKAMLWCIFGGIFGLHYFYVGRYLRGFLAACTLNFIFVGWCLDIVKIARGRFKDQYGEYLKE